MPPCPAPLSSNKVLSADLGLGLGLPGLSTLCQSLDCSDPQLSLFWITGWETEKMDPLVLAFLLGTAVGAAHNAAWREDRNFWSKKRMDLDCSSTGHFNAVSLKSHLKPPKNWMQ